MLILVVALQLGVPELSRAQENPDATALLLYRAQKKSEWGAWALEGLLPIVGHAYAGDAKRGVLPGVVALGGLAALLAGASCDSLCNVRREGVNNETLTFIGLGLLVGGRIWGMTSASDTAEDHNARLRQRLGISFGSQAGLLEVGLIIRL